MDIAVVGSLNYDMICVADRLPSRGETVRASTFMEAFGGKGANQAVAAARMGATIRMVGAVGSDDIGKSLRDNLSANGIDVSGIRVSGGPSGVALVTIDPSGDNTIVVVPGANDRIDAAWIKERAATIEGASCLVLQLEIPMEAVLAAARVAARAGVPVLLNPAPATALPDELLACCACVTPNETELAAISGESDMERGALRLLERGAGTVVVTLGSEGCLRVGRDGVYRVPSFRVDAIDATAAGDSFNGALATGIARGHGQGDAAAVIAEPLLRICNAAGALAATRLGAQPSIPTLKEVEDFLAAKAGHS